MNSENYNHAQSECQGCLDNRITEKLKKMSKLMMAIYHNNKTNK